MDRMDEEAKRVNQTIDVNRYNEIFQVNSFIK